MTGRSGYGFISRCLGALTISAVALGGQLAAARPAAAETPVTAVYEIYFGGFHVLDATAVLENGGADYRISGEAEVRGFLSWFSSWKGTTESRGRFAAGKVIPRSHDNRGSSGEGERLVTLRYDDNGDIVESLVAPEQDWVDRHPLPADAGKGTLDPLSVIAGLSQLLQAGASCDGSFAVFDGRRRYDLTVADAGTKTLAPTRNSIFEGEARGCRLEYELLGGHRVERNKYAATARDRVVWVARLAEGTPLIPVRLEIETASGKVMGHLTGYSLGEGRGVFLTD